MDTLGISNLTSYANSIASSTSTDALKDKAKNAQSDEELMEACKEFESYLWEQVVKSMKNTVNPFGEEEQSSVSQTTDFFMDTAISDVAKSLTEQNGGPTSLAQQMYDQMKRTNTIDVETLLAQSAAESGLSGVSSEE